MEILGILTFLIITFYGIIITYIAFKGDKWIKNNKK